MPRSDGMTMGGLTTEVNESRLPWIEYQRPYGVLGFKFLHLDMATGTSAMLARFPVGLKIPTHKHLAPVQAWVVSGSWHYLEYEWVGTAGSFIYEPLGSEHTLEVLEDGISLFIMDGPRIELGPDNKILSYVDSFTMRDDYRSELEARGLEYPAELIER
jgi:2,4'-dihydroxyacetophenone dioxygenase